MARVKTIWTSSVAVGTAARRSLNQGASLERAVPIDSHIDDGSSSADGEGGWDDESVDLDWDKCRVSDGDVAKSASYELDGEPCA